MSECIHCGRGVDGLFMLPSGDFYLCKTCYESAIDFVGDPTIHHWETVHVAIEGRGSDTTYVVERCRICGDLRVDDDTEVVEWNTPDDDEDDPVRGVVAGDDADDEGDRTADRPSRQPSTEPSPRSTGWE